MKLLPKKEIDKAKAQERKTEIDSGIALAKSVDGLRVQLSLEKKNLTEWREGTLKKIQHEIDQRIEERLSLERQCDGARELRNELLEPLDKEWEEVNFVREKINQELKDTYSLSEELKRKEKILEEKTEELKNIILRQKKNEQDIEKAKSEVYSLKDLAQREYEMAHEEHVSQTQTYDKAMSETSKRREEYEVALSVIQIRENEVKEKEVELLSREKHLESQQVALRIVMEEIKKNAS